MSHKQIFPLKNASELGCFVQRYMIGHSGLYIRVMRGDVLVCYLYFYAVEYISAPVSWGSADFTIAPYSDCQKLLRKLGYSDEWIADVFPDSRTFLYEVKLHDLPIHILCGGVERLNYDIQTMKWVEEEE